MDLEKSKQLSKEISYLTSRVSGYYDAKKTIDDAEELIELAEMENDEETALSIYYDRIAAMEDPQILAALEALK